MGGQARVGCSGWSYTDWRGAFYPRGLPQRCQLEHYATRFDTVEVNSTFYRLPRRDAVANWVQQTPADFLFVIKASRYLTHIKRLKDLGDGVDRFYERIEPLLEAGRLGAMLWQLPPNLKRDDELLASALNLLPPGRHAFEFRHPSWFAADVCRLLDAHDAAFVVAHDARRELPPAPKPAAWRFVRLHYGERGRRGNYSDAELQTWGRRVAQWRRRQDVYVFFNNDWEAFAPHNAIRLRRSLGLTRD